MIGLARSITAPDETLFGDDRARDHDDRARDHDDHARDHGGSASDHGGSDGDHSRTKPFERKRGYQYADNYPDPITGDPLQVYPTKGLDEFDSSDEWFRYQDALTRWTNYLPPRRPMPKGDTYADNLPTASGPRSAGRSPALKSRHVGVRLSDRDFKLLDELARAHAVRPGTMARMLIVRAVRAAADAAD